MLVRGGDDRTARARLGEILCHYFGPEKGSALRDNPRLTVLAGDLRRDDLGLSSRAHDRLADGLQAVFHCAANVKHFGHYWEFHADNVAATGRLLKLAAHRASNPADFHLVSTLSVCGKAPEDRFRLFTEYDTVPEVLDENYYIRSKQEAERLVVRPGSDLANACIHRVGNLVFAAEGGPLQFNIRENAFFRLLAAFLRLGVAAGRFPSVAVPCGYSGARTGAAGGRGRSDQRNPSSGECPKGYAGRFRQCGRGRVCLRFRHFPGAAGGGRDPNPKWMPRWP